MGEKGAQWLVTLARLWCTSATSVPPFSHPERYLVGTFLAILGPFVYHFLTPEGRCAVFSADLDSLGGQDCTPFLPEIAKSPKVPKIGVPLF